MTINIEKVVLEKILPLRSLFLAETNRQIRYNACHERGWSDSYLLLVDGRAIGYGSVKGREIPDRDTVFEFYVIPPFRHHASELFAAILAAAQPRFIECQSNTKPSEWQRRAFITTGNLDKDAALIWETMYLHGGPDISVVNLHDTTFPGPFTGTISCHDIRHALRATIFLDWMEGREWTRCKACRRVFKRTSKHPQFYCCSACASRARQATFRKNRANHRRGRR
jgi:hypothetical protein